MTEDDYLHEDASKIKKESTPSTELVTPVASFSSVAAPLASTSAIASSSRVRSTTTNAQGRRPRRSAAASVKSYVVPDSDDEAIADDKMYIDTSFRKLVKEVKEQPAETHLQQWIKHLAALVKEEQKKVCAPYPFHYPDANNTTSVQREAKASGEGKRTRNKNSCDEGILTNRLLSIACLMLIIVFRAISSRKFRLWYGSSAKRTRLND